MSVDPSVLEEKIELLQSEIKTAAEWAGRNIAEDDIESDFVYHHSMMFIEAQLDKEPRDNEHMNKIVDTCLECIDDMMQRLVTI